MATKPLTQFNMARVNRRSGGIGDLANVYKQQAGALADQYESEFSKYQRMVAEKMAPYQAAVENYKTNLEPAYQTALLDYNTKLSDYQAKLAEIAADPVTERKERVVTGRTWYGKKKYGDVTFFDPKPIPEFTDKAPEMPNIPQAPELAPFDSAAVDAKGQQIRSDFQREVGERKASRLGAVQRKSRTLLGGVKA